MFHHLLNWRRIAAFMCASLLLLLAACGKEPTGSDVSSPDGTLSQPVGADPIGETQTQTTLTVPDVTGMPQKTAEQELKTAGYTAACSEAYGAAAPGSVLSQTPAAGEALEIGGTVQLVISKGLQTVATGGSTTVPSVTGKTLEAAQSILSQAGLYYTVSSRLYHESIPAGQIISQNPAKGTAVKTGLTVTLTVSLGKRPTTSVPTMHNPYQTVSSAPSTDHNNSSDGNVPYYLPDLVGMNVEKAQLALSLHCVSLAYMEEYHNTIPAGSIISQATPAGTKMEIGVTVDVVVSRGPYTYDPDPVESHPATAPVEPVNEEITVPDLVGKGVSTAEFALSRAPLDYTIVEEPNDRYDDGYVFRQSVAAGSKVKKNSPITIYVSQGKPLQVLQFQETSKTLRIGESYTVTLEVKKDNADLYRVITASSNPAVATVLAPSTVKWNAHGYMGVTITAQARGTTTVTVRVGSSTAVCSVTVE